MALIAPEHQLMNTDLYQLTMAAGYHVHQPRTRASFELTVRKLPAQRSFLVAAGLEQALEYLQNLQSSPEELAWLKKHPAFAQVPAAFFTALAELRFSGDVWALPEGTVFFPHEPVLRIEGSLLEAQLVETWLLALLNYQISVASKAARIQLAIANSGRPCRFLDFGSRRAHGPQAALLAARAAFIGGASGTSNVLAAQELGIPCVGTAAHAWIMAFPSEAEAFAAYRELFPEHGILLVDTYDSLQGVRNAIASGPGLQGIRLDSGDFLSLSHASRRLLDAAGLNDTQIVVSGDMNEERIRDLLHAGAPVDSFGVGTELVTSLDAPSLGGVYKLVEIESAEGQRRPTLKLSPQKTSYPGRKQIWRSRDVHGQLDCDTLSLSHETEKGEALLVQVMAKGERLLPAESLQTIQARTRQQLAQLPYALRQLEEGATSPVRYSHGLLGLTREIQDQLTPKEMLIP
ncbi:MAG: nicotinate phosphoribosyltransferase [Candidatus Sericytochromatia bacterium]